MYKTETLMSVAIALLAVSLGSSPTLACGKGPNSTEAQARADAIGCATQPCIKTMGNGCLVRMKGSFIVNCAINETGSPDPAKSATHP